MDKKIVHYHAFMGESIVVGHPALIYPLDHPSPDVSNTKMAITSLVISVDRETGDFETENTRYVALVEVT